MAIELKYIDQLHLKDSDYQTFLKKYYIDNREYNKHVARNKWYESGLGYKVLLAIDDGKLIGQACAFKVIAVINSKEQEWWWGVDNFVLKEYRGIGIGKLLQQKLTNDLPNFSSAKYATANGYIKRKVGQKELFGYNTYYYPVSRYFTVAIEALLRKFIKNNIKCAFKVPQLYASLNLHNSQKLYVEETTISDDVVNFISNSLKKNDFYIKRNLEYLKWKYDLNPTLRYKLLSIVKDGNTLGFVFVSDPYKSSYIMSDVKIVNILDCFIKEDSKYNTRDILAAIVRYFKEQGINLDGIVSLDSAKWFPKIKYPYKKMQVLSTYNKERPIIPYLSMIDQDMETMPIDE